MLHRSNRLFNTPLLCLALLVSTAVTATAHPIETTNSEELSTSKSEIDKQFNIDRQLLEWQFWRQHQQQLDYQQQQLRRQNQQLQRDLRQQQLQDYHQQIRNQQQQQLQDYQQRIRNQQQQLLQQDLMRRQLQQQQLQQQNLYPYGSQ